jgi:uncharacterized protein YcbX
MYRIEAIFIYPIKSFAGISMQTAYARSAGFEHDRRWMLIDEDGRFISQREHPKLALFQIAVDAEKLCIQYEADEIGFDLDLRVGFDIQATIWDDSALVNEVDLAVSDWLSERIGSKVRLVKLKTEQSRKHHSSRLSKDISVSLADGYPYLIIGDKSLTHLNQLLDVPVLMNRFRPNIVITTDLPHEEDEINLLTFGQVELQNVKPCGRCILINTNQELATVGKEPLRTLSTYRKRENSIHFGSNFICTNSGLLEVGMISTGR